MIMDCTNFFQSTKFPHFPLRGMSGQLRKRKRVLYCTVLFVYASQVPVNSSPVSKSGDPDKHGGNIVSGWCLAVHRNYCTLDTHLLRSESTQ